VGQIAGFGWQSYRLGLETLIGRLAGRRLDKEKKAQFDKDSVL
jgi:hypothetical protein